MLRLITITTAIAVLCVSSPLAAIAQQQGQGGITAGGSLGGGTQGGRLSQGSIGANSNSNVQLSSRFQSDPNRFAGGTQSLGQTTAGLTAAQGVVGGGGGQFGVGGFGGRGGGLTSSLFGLGALRSFGRGGGGFGQQGASQQQQQGQIRTHLVIAFPTPLQAPAGSPTVQQIRSKAMDRVARSLRRAIPGATDRVQVQLDGATAVLRGAVASDHQKKLAELLVKMEPGIADVRNELTVGPGGPTQ